MDKQVDYYKVLQVHHDAGPDIIDAAYRCLSKMYHPDRNKHLLALERMQEINAAYEIIGNGVKRREYHLEWMKHHVRETGFTGRVRGEEEAATLILDEFFCETINERWEQAYGKLTRTDREHVPLADFLEWRQAVSELYKLGNYKIAYFRKYSNCDYAGVNYPLIIQFSVGLTEMEISTGQIREETAQKYVAYDGRAWRVCLGYTDLKPTVMKFRCLAKSLPKLNHEEAFLNTVAKIDFLTGLPNLLGFLEQMDREMLRSQRYGNPLSLAVIAVQPEVDEKRIPDENQLDACAAQVGEIIWKNIRKTDVIGRCGPSSFAILFIETGRDEAAMALEKLIPLCEGDEYLNYNVYFDCVTVNRGRAEKIMSVLLKRMKRRSEKQNSFYGKEKSHF